MENDVEFFIFSSIERNYRLVDKKKIEATKRYPLLYKSYFVLLTK